MAFAISMLSEQSGMQRSFLEQKITQAGGLILEDGFQGLFEASPAVNARGQIIEEGDALRLAQASSDCGFTALIADGHSRKSKYMQALALGLPCLAHQWISACLARGEIVDWQPYLLAAGVSAALGDAVRSRCLRPYPAVGARLAESVEQRPRLLAGQSLLLVANPKGAWSSTKEYIFLAQALGPRVHRVCTARDAYEALSAREKDRHVFDWIYIDEAIGTVDLLLPVENRPAAGKKRKKTAVIPPRVHDIRVLSNELVIQSLISGRMIGEDEIPEKGYRG
ncbi:DNA repair protein rhp9 [Escovopsis weberi]|uniref:DNA repair protein rhp9 n=1 Tax=Escovopsis weberi TaxID=150374 RepID=A0A0M8MUH2_ESCWE|nr:DNA repair protein rhp9 [Escovopsis weberi]